MWADGRVTGNSVAADREPKEPTPTALRMRRHRERRNLGFSTYPIEIHQSTLDSLVEKGLLSREGRDDKDQIVEVVEGLLRNVREQEEEEEEQEQEVGHCEFDLSAKQIDQLVKFDLLDAKSRADPTRVRMAFAELVRWAFYYRRP